MNKVLRFCVRPNPQTIRGWYVWAVESTPEGKEVWSKSQTATFDSKREAKRMCDYLNESMKEGN